MDLTVLFLAVPKLSADLAPSSTQLLWISDIYGFMVAGWLITMGTLGDRIGRRRLLLIGAAFFGAVSVLAAFAPSAASLIAARALLGVAGATVAPSTLSLIRNMFHDPQQRTFAIGVWVTSFSVGGVIGPLVGGVLLEYFWWGSVFLMAVPVMTLLLIVGPRFLPEFRDPAPGRLDLYSAGLSLGAVLGVIYGIKRLAADGAGWAPLLAIAAGVVLGTLFIRRQQRLTYPLIDVRLFRQASFSAPLATYLLAVFVVFGVSLLTAQYLQLVLRLSPLDAGIWTLPSAAGFVVGSLVAPLFVRRVAPGVLMGVCMVIAAGGYVLIAQANADTGLAAIVIGSTIAAVSVAPVVTLATDLIVGTVPAERAGAAGAISETSAELGGALSIAILGSIATAVYRRDMGMSAISGIPQDVLASARTAVAQAVTTAEQLSPEQSRVLLAAAYDAFTSALRVTAATSAALALLTAVIVFTALRNVAR
jgi:DHA2 family multidrug resistance protein-like MFS transporter